MQKKCDEESNEFYYQSHIFVHRKKVPFMLDSDNLFKTPRLKKGPIKQANYSK